MIARVHLLNFVYVWLACYSYGCLGRKWITSLVILTFFLADTYTGAIFAVVCSREVFITALYCQIYFSPVFGVCWVAEHKCVVNSEDRYWQIDSIGWDNGLSYVRSRAIIWTSVSLLLIGRIEKKFQWNLFQNGCHFVPASMCYLVFM